VNRLRSLHASWLTVGLVATAVAFADGFWLTSMSGAVGAIERLSPPFERWMRDSLLMVPFFLVAVVVALLLARRWVGEHRRPAVQLLMAGGLMVACTFVVGVLEVAVSSGYDYYLQTHHIVAAEHLQHPTYRIVGTTPVLVGSATCDAICQAKTATWNVHVRAFWLAAGLIAVTNTVVVAWALALRGGTLWLRRPQPVVTTAAGVSLVTSG
jgi:hypothetical protein